jgi:hypothetical protein
MKDSILALVRDRQHVTFDELGRSISGFTGDMLMVHSSDPNLVIWPFCTKEGIAAINDLISTKRLFYHPISDWTIMTMERPNIRRASRPPKNGYKDLRWLPVCLCDYPVNTKRGKKRG